MGFNCDFCIAREMMGNKAGRICLLYQVDFTDGDILEYSSRVKDEQISGVIHNQDELHIAIDELLKAHKTDRIDIALKFIKPLGLRYGGICIKSFPRSELTGELLSLLNLCLGGPNGTDLLHLPFSGGLFDQPNLFVEAYFVYKDEMTKYLEYQRSQKKDNETHRQFRGHLE